MTWRETLPAASSATAACLASQNSQELPLSYSRLAIWTAL